MGERSRLNWARAYLFASLVAGWLVGFAIHGSAAAESGWGDVPWPALWLGVGLCAWAGVVAWISSPGHRRRRFGALAGLAMFGSFLAGNILVAVLWVHPPVGESSGGETWFSLLLESWFWLGLPVLVSLALGAMGWTVTDVLGRGRALGSARS